MSNTALAKAANKSIEVKSLKDLVRARGFENVVLLVDVSLSMDYTMRNGKKRIEGLRDAVATMLAKRPTTMIGFGVHNIERPMDEVAFITDIPEPAGGTPMAEAIAFARAHGFGRAVIISDGGPNNPQTAMEEAVQFGGRIDVVYVGDPGDMGSVFLDRLAAATGGTRFEGDLTETKQLGATIAGLLTGDVELEEVDDEDEDDEEDDEDDEEDDEDDEEG